MKQRSGKVAEVIENLDIHPNVLNRWIREVSEDPEYAFPGEGKLTSPDEEVHRLKKEIRDFKKDRDILKK